MKRWPTKLLGEVAKVVAGDPAPQGAEDFSDDGFPFVRMQDVGRNGHTTNLVETKDRLSASASRKLKRFPIGSILVPKSGASIRLNHRAILGVEAHVVSHLAVIVPHASLNNHFAYYWLCGIDLSGVAHDADLPSMKTSELAKLQIPFPPLAEQERIVKLLDEAMELRKLRILANHQADSLLPAIFHEMFGDPTANEMKWPVNPLAELCRSITDIDHKMPKSVESGIPFISAKDLLDDGTLSFENVKTISEDDFRQLARKSKPEKGDIIYSRIGAKLGKARMVKVDFNFLASYSCCTIKPKHELVDVLFLCHLLDSPSMLKQAHKGVRAIGVPDLGMGEIKNFQIITPPIASQMEFAQRVTEIRELEASQATSRTRLDALFQSMLHRAFNGEL